MIPLFHNTAALPPGEPSGTHYLLAANGLFLVQDTPLFHALTRVTQRHDLQSASTSIHLRIPRLPQHLLEEAYGFFLEIFHRHQSEAFATILYAPASQRFTLAIPAQRLTQYADGQGHRTALGVWYDTVARPPGTVILGDIHSHGRLPAYFSHTDNHDDLTRDGLHLVIGCLHHGEPDLCASFVTNRTRFDLAQNDTLEPFNRPIPPPESWLAQITIETRPAPAWPSIAPLLTRGEPLT
jgi:PRTRC genetic system protein A